MRPLISFRINRCHATIDAKFKNQSVKNPDLYKLLRQGVNLLGNALSYSSR